MRKRYRGVSVESGSPARLFQTAPAEVALTPKGPQAQSSHSLKQSAWIVFAFRAAVNPSLDAARNVPCFSRPGKQTLIHLGYMQLNVLRVMPH
jgi:hypothetical protein